MTMGFAMAFALAALGDKEDLAAAVKKMAEAKSFAYKSNGGWSGQALEGSGEFERPGVWTVRHPQFQWIQAGDKARFKGNETTNRWSDPASSSNSPWYLYTMFLYRPDIALDAATKAEKVTAGGKVAAGGVDCASYKVEVSGKELRAALGRLISESMRKSWEQQDNSYDWESSGGTIEVAVDRESGWVRRVGLEFTLQYKREVGAGGQPMNVEFTLDGFDATRAQIPKDQKKALGMGEG